MFYGLEKEVAKVKMMLDIAAATTDVAREILDSKSVSSTQPPSKKLKTDDSVPTIDTTQMKKLVAHLKTTGLSLVVFW